MTGNLGIVASSVSDFSIVSPYRKDIMTWPYT